MFIKANDLNPLVKDNNFSQRQTIEILDIIFNCSLPIYLISVTKSRIAHVIVMKKTISK